MENAVEKEIKADAGDAADENEPIYYKPGTLSLVSAILPWVSWVVLAVYVFVVIAQVSYLMGIATQNGTSLNAMFVDPQQGEQVRNFVYTNMLLPLFSGITYFLLLQAAALGLNALLEIDFNVREARS